MPRDNGSVRQSELTSRERAEFAQIARDNGTTSDPVVDSLVDAGVTRNKARSYAAEMRKRENGGVTALALALPNPAGPRSVPPDLSGIRSKEMAKFVGPGGLRDNKSRRKRDNKSFFHSKKRDNRSVTAFTNAQNQANAENLNVLYNRMPQPPLSPEGGGLTQQGRKAVADFYLNMGKGRGSKLTTTKAGKRNTRNLAAYAIADYGHTHADASVLPDWNLGAASADGAELIVGLVPYTGILTAGGAGGGNVVPVGPLTKPLFMALSGTNKVQTGRKARVGDKKMRQFIAKLSQTDPEAGAAALDMLNSSATRRRKISNAVIGRDGTVKKPAVYVEEPIVPTAAKSGMRYSAQRSWESIRDRGVARVTQLQKAILYAHRYARDEFTPEQQKQLDKLAKLAATSQEAFIDEVKRNNRSARRKGFMKRHNARHNAPVHRARHNQGGMDAKTIGYGIAGFAGGTVVGTLLNDLVVSKVSAAKLPVLGTAAIPTLVAAGLAADAYFSHTDRGYVFRRIPNIGLRYGLAAGLIFPMIARTYASKLLKLVKLDKIDSFYGSAPVSGFGLLPDASIYDTAFAQNGFGEYLTDRAAIALQAGQTGQSGFGEYLDFPLQAEEYASESGLGADAVVYPAQAGLSNYVRTLGEVPPSPATVFAAQAGLAGAGGARVVAATGVGSASDTAGELDAAYLDGVGIGPESVADFRKFAGVGGDDDSDDDFETDGEEMSDEDLAIEGLGAVPGASMMRMTQGTAAKAARIAQVQILGRSKRIPGTLIVAVLKTGRGRIPNVGGINPVPSSVDIPPAPAGQANFRPGGIFAETIFGGRGFMG